MRNIQNVIVLVGVVCLQFLAWNVFFRPRKAKLEHNYSCTSPSVCRNNSTVSSKMYSTRTITAQIENSLGLYRLGSALPSSENIVHTSVCASPTPANYYHQNSSTNIQSVSSGAKTSDSKNGPKLLCLEFHERLGNQMFEYASVLGIALKTKRIPVFLNKGLIGEVLSNTTFFENSVKYENRCKEAFLHEPSCCKFFSGFFELDPDKDYTIARNLQSWKYFIEHETEIRQSIKFKDTIMSQAQTIVTSLRQKYKGTLAGVHIRRGDYLGQKSYGRKIAPIGYLMRAMDYIKKRYSNATFVVCSEDVNWCNQQFANKSDVTVLQDHSSEAVDMMVLASLDHMIMTVGTYGWWASFLNPGITIYFRDFAYPNTYFSSRFTPNGTDHYCPNWIHLS